MNKCDEKMNGTRAGHKGQRGARSAAARHGCLTHTHIRSKLHAHSLARTTRYARHGHEKRNTISQFVDNILPPPPPPRPRWSAGSTKVSASHLGDSVSRPAQKSQPERKKACDKFGSVSKGPRTNVKSVHTGRESEGHLSCYSAQCAYNFTVHVSTLCVRHMRSAGSLLSFHSWNVHDSVPEPDMCKFSQASAAPEI